MKSSELDPILRAWSSLSDIADKAAIFDPSGRVLRTFGQIEEEADQFENNLLRDRKSGEVVAVQIGNHPAWPALLLALWRLRLVAMPLEPTIIARELDNILRTCSAVAIITPAVASQNTESNQLILRSRRHDKINWGPNPPSLLKLTSGTTAAPRAVRFLPKQLLADCTQICETMGIQEDDLNFGVIPVSHSYGFSNLLTPLLTRGIPLVLSNDRLPRAILAALDGTAATVFPGMPVFYQALADIENVPALPRLRLCISAGAPLPLNVAQRFRDKFGHPIHSFYGSSECGGICYDRSADVLKAGFVGLPLVGVELEALEPSETSTRIHVRSAAVGDGYFPEPDEERLGNRQFTPDDLLKITGRGAQIVGRASDLINVAGKKVNPAEVEAVLLRFAGVGDAIAFGRESPFRSQEVAACVVMSTKIQESDLLRHCRTHLSGWQIPKRIFFVDEIPVNDRGKVSRRELALRFHQ